MGRLRVFGGMVGWVVGCCCSCSGRLRMMFIRIGKRFFFLSHRFIVIIVAIITLSRTRVVPPLFGRTEYIVVGRLFGIECGLTTPKNDKNSKQKDHADEDESKGVHTTS